MASGGNATGGAGTAGVPSGPELVTSAANAYWNTSTNRIYTTLLGTGAQNGEYAGGSAVQGPTVTINVTATAPAGTDLQMKLAGQLPGSEPRNYTGSQPGNFRSELSVQSLNLLINRSG